MRKVRFSEAVKALIGTLIGIGVVGKVLHVIFGVPTGKNIPLAILMIAVILAVPSWVFVKQNFSSPSNQK